MLQLDLFPDLPIPREAVAWKPAHARRQMPRLGVEAQLSFTFRLRSLQCDRDTEFDFPTHAVVPAGETAAPETTAVNSVFALADRFRRHRKQREMKPEPGELRKVATIVKDGVTRFFGAAYPARWTPEDEERERRRRARQRPPRPTKKVRTIGKKLADLVGPGNDDADEDE